MRTSTGSARRFHDREPRADTGHEVWIHQVSRPAVILGSTQLPGGFDEDRGITDSGVEVCRRRSGGGLVIVRPDDVWIDAVIPRHSPLHTDDVGRAFHWFGQVWLEALRSRLGGPGFDDRDLRLAETPAGRRAADRPFFCFADVGHGEVLHRDHKVVGLSQRRTRNWTRLQSLLIAVWGPAEIDGLVTDALSGPSGSADPTTLGAPPHTAAAVRAGFAPSVAVQVLRPNCVIDAVLERLPVVTHDDH
ncbi:MAG: hypothetical protein OES24_15345 [Acidimicrobiia bacterium]|nr:hypothetical protein [Acidimicrobiia bacterium]